MARQQGATRDRQELARRMAQGSGEPRKGRIRRYLQGVRTELRAVEWPTRRQLRSYATVVFVTLVLVVALIFLLNVVFAKGVSLLYG
ncbi:preprotein translocase, SecE subunit [Acidimicrobium ferrooxidans DSM 10331]|uniref:Protein translocase subunit SecE n=1 Tax=Acidimicrobium ferrooxidans (strain DSM 10331 / JCM 15462 / NBRC 103882 / ICP) TaxID=525909 RepID=C7M2V9_ACIFD|nr:preprotein translocase subunit SecE [Acidimicrobium ferrooxidans]ACU53353.1 preprotein translocase, SecE subunit [Acidimicrobium ferrooxidans DSM 10331]